MSLRKLPWLELLITVVVALVCWYVYTTKMEWRDVTVHNGPSTLARSNDLLASTRLLEEFGYQSENVKDISFFNNLDRYPNDILWLYTADALTEEKSFEALKAWTNNGGHLILGLNYPMSEPLHELLHEFGLRVTADPDDIGVIEPWMPFYNADELDVFNGDDDATAPRPHPEVEYGTGRSRSGYSHSRLTRKAINTIPQAMTVNVSNRVEIFSSTRFLDGIRWPKAISKRDAFVNVQFEQGDGIVTVLGDAAMFSNDHLKLDDNGAYLLELLSRSSAKTVRFFTEERNTPTLTKTLWQNFSPTIAMLGVALLAWVVYAAARLGPIRTESVPGRTNLISHLRARGHFWRRRGTLAPMTEPVRQAALREIKRQFPHMSKSLDDPTPNELLINLANDINRPVSQVKKALSPEPLPLRDLPDAAFVLQHILHTNAPRTKAVNKAIS